MPRKKRIWMPEAFYHVISRGNRRQPLFHRVNDYVAFYHIINQFHEKSPLEIASFCLMTNHFHIQLRSRGVPISKVMGVINKRYANYYNTHYQVTGHVFEKRFFDKVLLYNEDMIEVSKYIHLNPVRAGMVKKPESYQWSSYGLFRNKINHPLKCLNPSAVLDLLGENCKVVRKKYSYLIEKDMEIDQENNQKGLSLDLHE